MLCFGDISNVLEKWECHKRVTDDISVTYYGRTRTTSDGQTSGTPAAPWPRPTSSWPLQHLWFFFVLLDLISITVWWSLNQRILITRQTQENPGSYDLACLSLTTMDTQQLSKFGSFNMMFIEKLRPNRIYMWVTLRELCLASKRNNDIYSKLKKGKQCQSRVQ